MNAFLDFIESLPAWMQVVVWASIHATVLALLVLALQPLLRRYVPARWRFVLWMLVLVRFVPLPLPESRWSPFNWTLHDSRRTAMAAPSPVSTVEEMRQNAPSASFVASPPTAASSNLAAVTAIIEQPRIKDASSASSTPIEVGQQSTKSSPSAASHASPATQSFPWLPTIFFLGAAVIFIRLLLSTMALRSLLRRAAPVEHPAVLAILAAARGTFDIRQPIPLLASEHVISPALVGLWRPRMLVPGRVLSLLSADELRLVFLHECAHLRRRDVLVNYLLAAVSVMHWFNPLLWLITPRIRADRELATDELVLLRAADAVSYGHTLLKLLESTTAPARGIAPAAVGIIETRTFFARRIHMIAAFRKPPAWLAFPVGLGLAVVAACAFTAPLSRAQEQPAIPPTPELPAMPVMPAAGTPIPMPSPPPAVSLNPVVVDATGAPAMTVLDKHVSALSVNDTSIEKVLAFLGDSTAANMVVNWNALNPAGIDRNTLVTISLKDVPLRKVLHAVLDLAAGGSGKADYQLEDGVITISSVNDLNEKAEAERIARERDLQTRKAAQWNAASTDVLQKLDLLRHDPNSPQLSQLNQQIQQMIGQQMALIGSADAAVTKAVDAANAAAGRLNAGPVDIERDPTLLNLKSTKMELEQERAAKMAAGPAGAAEIKALDAKLDVIDDQIKQIRQELQERANEKMKQQAADTPAKVMRIYDVREIVGVPGVQTEQLNADQRAAVSELAGTLNGLIGGEHTISTFNGMIVVSAAGDEQDKVARILAEFQARQADRRNNAKH